MVSLNSPILMGHQSRQLLLGQKHSTSVRTGLLAIGFFLGTIGLFAFSSKYPELLSGPDVVGIFLVVQVLAVLVAGIQAYRNDGWMPAISVGLAPLVGTFLPFGITLSLIALIVSVALAFATPLTSSGLRRAFSTR